MPNITLKGVPLKLYRELKRQADVERRSLNREVIRRLEESVAVRPDPAGDPEAFITHLRERKAQYGGRALSDDKITMFKRRGRP
jgi:hypothetical protein